AAAGRRSLAGDEADHGLAHLFTDKRSRLLLGIAADFTNHHNGKRFGIVVEHANGVEERSADDGIAADADARGLADIELGELADGFVSKRPAAADHAHV